MSETTRTFFGDVSIDNTSTSTFNVQNKFIVDTTNEIVTTSKRLDVGNDSVKVANSNVTTVGTITLSGDLVLSSATNPLLYMRRNGFASPSFTTRSTGTKIVLKPDLNASSMDIAIGAEASSMWSAIQQATSGYNFNWFAGVTNIMSLRGDGLLTLEGSQIIDTTSTEAFLVRKNADAGDIFAINSSSGAVSITGSITLSGTVDGRDLSVDGANLDTLFTTIGLSALTSAEVDQLENIGATTISATQWGYLGGTDQGVATSSNVQFNGVIADGTGAETLLVRKNADAGDVLAVNTSTNVVSVTGNITVSGTVDGRDISVDGANLDTLFTTIGLSALTSAEVDQLENIGATTISATQWGYLGAMNQNVATTSAVVFGGVTTGRLEVTGNTNGEFGNAIRNTNSGGSAVNVFRLYNDTTSLTMFLNSGARTTDGGVNTATIRNNAGTLRLLNSSSAGVTIQSGLTSLDMDMVIDVTDPEAFLVRKAGDTGDIFTVDTSAGNTIVTGSLGIGVNPPARQFHVQGSNAVWRLDRDQPSPALQIHRFPPGNFTTPWLGFTLGVGASDVTTGNFYIGDLRTAVGGNATTRLIIDDTGNVGIGTSTLGSKLGVSGNQIIDTTDSEALLVRKNGDTGDIFTVDTSSSIVTVNNTLNFVNSGAPLIHMQGSGAAAPTFTTRSSGTKLVLYESLSGSLVDYAIGVASSTVWFSIPEALNTRQFRWYGGITSIMDLEGNGHLKVFGTVNATSSTVGGSLTISGGAAVAKDLYVGGNITVSGTVDGRDVAADGATLDALNGNGMSLLTSAEVDQLENINTTIISTTQWGYLGGMNQGVATSNNVTFSTLVLDNTNSEALLVRKAGDTGDLFRVDTTNDRVLIGSGNPVADIAQLHLYGTSGSSNGPHWMATTTADTYPVFQQLNWTHDNISLAFDAYHDGTDWRSADFGSNFQIYKFSDLLRFTYASGVSTGSVISPNPVNNIGFSMSNTGLVQFEQGTITDVTSTSALVVRKDGDTGDVFTVDTTNSKVKIGGQLVVGNSSSTNAIVFNGVTGDLTTSSAIIVERLYDKDSNVAVDNDHSELLLGNFNDPITNGPDRIRCIAGEYIFSTYVTPQSNTLTTTNLDNVANFIPRLHMDYLGQVDILATIQSTSTTSGALVVWGGAGVVKDLYVGGNITVSGTVDGRDISVDGATLTNLATTIGLSALTSAEVDQLENIGATTISATQWGYLGGTDQGVATSSNVQFNGVIADGTGAETLLVRKNVDAGDVLAVNTSTNVVSVTGSITLSGNITVSGTVDGRDIAADGATLTNLATTIGLSALTSAEVDQLENIGSTTISATQWGYLGGTDQGVATSSNVQFNSVIVDSTATEALLVRKNADAGDIFTVDTSAGNTIVTGSLGIGVNPPARQFHVQGSNAVWRLDRDQNDPTLQIHRFPSGNFTTPWLGFVLGVGATDVTTGNFYISDMRTTVDGTGSVTRLIIDDTGNIGIGTSTLGSKLSVSGNQIIDTTDSEALLVRKNGNTGDVFTVDTTNSKITVYGDVIAQNGAGVGSLFGADLSATTITDSVRKFARLGMPHYTIAEEPITLICGDSDGTNNYVYIGGGSTALNSATSVLIRAGATTTTVTGSTVASFTSGLFTVETDTVIDVTDQEAFLVRKNGDTGDIFTVDTTNDRVLIGSGNPVVDAAQLHLYGTASSSNGPHLMATTTTDIYPVFQQLNWTHDNIVLFFDAYFDGSNTRSSDVGSNYSIWKFGDQLKFTYASGVSAGSVTPLSSQTSFFINTLGLVIFEQGTITDVTSTEALLVRKDGDTGDIFTVDTSNSIVTVNNTLNFVDSGVPLINMQSSGAAAPTFTTRSGGTKLVLYESLSGSSVDYAIGVASSTVWFSIPEALNSRQFRWYGGTTQLMDLRGDGLLTLDGSQIIDTTSTEAFLIRKNGNTGDVFAVDTTNRILTMRGRTSMYEDLTTSPNIGGGWFRIINGGGTYTDNSTAASGTASGHSTIGIGQMTLAATNSSVTTTNAASLYIAGAPVAGTNQTITNSYALWVDSGNVQLDGDLTVLGAINGGSSVACETIIVDSTSTEAFLIRKNGDTGDVFTVDTTNSIVTVNNTLNFVDSGTPLINMQSVSQGFPTFTTRSVGTKIVLYDTLDGSNTDYAIGVASNTYWNSIPSSTRVFHWYAGTTAIAELDGSGQFTCIDDIIAFGSVSDETLKKDILEVSTSMSLDIVGRLRPVKYTWKEDIQNTKYRNKEDVGFIAQEVEEVIPLAVSDYTELNTGDVKKSLRHERMIPYLVGAIQELTQIVENQSMLIKELQEELTLLKN